MTNFIWRMISSRLARLFGDINLLHEGKFLFLDLGDKPKKSSKKEDSVSLQSALQSTKGIRLPQVPDVSSFNLRLNGYNPALLAHQLITRMGSNKVAVKGRNARINRYLKYMYLRCINLKSRPNAYWTVVGLFIQRSNSYLIACLHGIDNNLYRTMHMTGIMGLIKSVNSLRAHKLSLKTSSRTALLQGTASIAQFASVIKFRRVFIPKAPGKVRPLGVPAKAWRIYLRMWLFPLQVVIPVGEYQHGVVPGKGVLTALNVLTGDALSKRNVWEVDFRGFFPSIQPDYIEKMFDKVAKSLPPTIVVKELWDMKSMSMKPMKMRIPGHHPSGVVNYLRTMNESKPVYGPRASAEKSLAETLITHGSLQNLEYEVQMLLGRGSISQSKALQAIKVCQDWREYLNNSGIAFATALKDSPIHEGNFTYFTPGAQISSAHLAVLHSHFIGKKQVTALPGTQLRGEMVSPVRDTVIHMGLPQGSPLSPYLSAAYFHYVHSEIAARFPSVQLVIYVDDVVYYSDNDEEFAEFVKEYPALVEGYGLHIAESKSHLVKSRGTWLRPTMKFLGYRGFFPEGTSQPPISFASDTRRGTRKAFEYESLNQLTHSLTTTDIGTTFFAKVLLSTSSKFEGCLTFVYMYLYMLDRLLSGGIADVMHARQLLTCDSGIRAELRRFISLTADKRELAKQAKPGGAISAMSASIPGGIPRVLENLIQRTPLHLHSPAFPKPFGGLVLSRLFKPTSETSGFDTPTGSQDFHFRTTTGSLGHIIQTKYPEVTLSVGSSYACMELVRLASSITNRKPIKIFSLGPCKAPSRKAIAKAFASLEAQLQSNIKIDTAEQQFFRNTFGKTAFTEGNFYEGAEAYQENQYTDAHAEARARWEAKFCWFRENHPTY